MNDSLYLHKDCCFNKVTTRLLLPHLIFLLLLSCNKKSGEKDASLSLYEKQIQLYQRFVDTALNSNSDSFLSRLDTILPQKPSYDYRITAYRQFLYAYRQYKRKNTDSARILFSRMLPYADTPRDYDLITLKQTGLAQLQINKGIDTGLFALLLPVLQLQEKYPSRFRWWPYDLTAKMYYQIRDYYYLAEEYINMACSSIPDTANYSLKARLLSHYSTIITGKKDYERALRLEDSAYRLALKAGDSNMIATATAGKGVLYIYLGDREKGYELQLQAFELKKRLRTSDLGLEYFNMAATYYEQKDFTKAASFAKEALLLGQSRKDDELMGLANEMLANVYQALGKYDSSIYFLAESYNMKLRLTTSEQNKAIASLQANYAIRWQRKQADELNRKNKDQEVILEQQRVIIYGVLSIAVVVSILVYIIFRQRAERKKIEYEQRLFRSQMEPHFIFNTISALRWFIRSGKQEQAIRFLNHFARLLRVNLEHSTQAFVPLVQEIEALEHYLNLQQMRFVDLFQYDITLYEGFREDNLLIPPMLLQPFVENAIYHGFRDIDYKGQIRVSIAKGDKVLHCSIEDNGRGLAQPSTGNGKRSLATDITKRRLRILGRKAGKRASKQIQLHIINKGDSGSGHGTLVKMAIPYQISAST